MSRNIKTQSSKRRTVEVCLKRVPGARNQKGWWRVKGANGRIVTVSQVYTRYRRAREAARNFAERESLKLVEVA